MKSVIRYSILFFVCCAVMLLSISCGDSNSSLTVDSLRVIHGADQFAMPDEEFPEELRVEALSTPVKNIFGMMGSPKPVPGVEIRFTPELADSLIPEHDSAVTNVVGIASVKLRAGRHVGDSYLKLSVPSAPSVPALSVRFVAGAKVTGARQEGGSGSVLQHPLSIQLVRQDGSPAADIPVYFTVLDSPSSKHPAGIQCASGRTDAQGRAEATVQLGAGTGPAKIGVEVADSQSGFYIRQKTVQVFGLDLVSVILTTAGGLAFFIYGMKLMGDGLLKVSGENMKRILQFFSRNRIVAILAGTVVTTIIQSSSATTVMVIGFINAGLLSLRQAIGIIFGANIGTTVTAQIIAFNLDAIALPAITLGLILMIFKKRIVNGWGESVLGFGLLFFGMTMMSTELKTLGTFDSFIRLFQSFDCSPVVAGGFMPIGAVAGAIAIGAVATFVIQSSSAAIGIILALAAGGLINFYTAVPLLIGTNIGTTITSFLAALAANRVAKQAALAHFLFNIVGTMLMLICFYIPYGPNRIPCFLYFINSITPGDVFASVPQGVERHIAMAHTFFNVFTVLLLTPLIGVFTKVCESLLPIRDSATVKTHALEPLLLATPAVAIDQVILELRKMVHDSWSMVDHAVNSHFVSANVDPEEFHKLREAEEQIDITQTAITNYLVQITRRQLTNHQSGIIPLLMHCTNDAERIADHTENILKLTKRLNKTGVHLSDIAVKDLTKMWTLLNSQAQNVTLALGSATDKSSIESVLESERKLNKLAKKYQKSFTRKHEAGALSMEDTLGEDEPDELFVEASREHACEENDSMSIVMQNEQQLNRMAKQYEKEHVDRRNRGQCAVETSVIFIEMIWELERIGDHLANIAVRTPEIQKHYFSI